MDPYSLHKLSYGIYVLTTKTDGKPYGCIINTAFQITATPARIAVSCNRDNFTHDKIRSSGFFGITVLSEECDSNIIGTFGYKSGRDTNKFANLEYDVGEKSGVPLLNQQGMATFECSVVDQLEVGTHTIFVGEVLDGAVTKTNAREMTYRYYHEVLKGAAPKNAPTFIEQEPVQAPKNIGELWKCSVCGYVYDSSIGEGENPAGTKFEDLPDNWDCPICGVGKEMFNKLE